MRLTLIVLLVAMLATLAADKVYVTTIDGETFKGEIVGKQDNEIVLHTVRGRLLRIHCAGIERISYGGQLITQSVFMRPDETNPAFPYENATEYRPEGIEYRLAMFRATAEDSANSELSDLPSRPDLSEGLLDGLHIETRLLAPYLVPLGLAAIATGIMFLDDAADTEELIDELEGIINTEDLENKAGHLRLTGILNVVFGVTGMAVGMVPVQVYVNSRGDIIGRVGVKF
ncbi:MAG: hypothetical protein K8R90_10160 [Candidatus Cloacimonetes bacterium]|nr:hypothetical protein [Candidatus Cloacimonadota bacterium]